MLFFSERGLSVYLFLVQDGLRPTSLRTVVHPSDLFRSGCSQTPFFGKNEKEPKKKAKRTEKERNSVRTTVGLPTP